ncbi:MAG: hypothetical protein AAF607_14340, partial [Pseudomonadota bacterium]
LFGLNTSSQAFKMASIRSPSKYPPVRSLSVIDGKWNCPQENALSGMPEAALRFSCRDWGAGIFLDHVDWEEALCAACFSHVLVRELAP